MRTFAPTLALVLACTATDKGEADSATSAVNPGPGVTSSGGTTSAGTPTPSTGTAAGTTSAGTTTSTTTPVPAPCVFAIPPTATVVTQDQGLLAAGTYWVCSDVTVTTTVSGTVVLLENGSDAVVNSENTDVWMKADSDLAMFQGVSNTVYHETGAVIAPWAGAVMVLCPSVTFDLVNAPVPGC